MIREHNFNTRRIPALGQQLLLLLLGVALFGGCNDAPGPVGSSYLPENVVFGSYTLQSNEFTVTNGTSVASNSSVQGASSIVVGAAASGEIAYALLAITNEAELLGDGVNRPITKAELVLNGSSYRFGDTASARATFDVVVLDEVFSVNTKWDEDLAGKIRNARILGTVDVPYGDTTAVVVDLNVEATAQFLKEYYKWDTISTSGSNVQREFRTLKTLVLRSRDDSRSIVSFLGVTAVDEEDRPTLRITLGDQTATLRVGATSWIAKTGRAMPESRMILDAGVANRSLLTFNLDSIPLDATIHQAELRLYPDYAGSVFGSRGIPSLIVGYIARDSSLSAGSYLTSSEGFIVAHLKTGDGSPGSEYYRITSLAPTISRWLRTARGDANGSLSLPNRGLIFAFNRATGAPLLETGTIDRILFHAPDSPDIALRPSLTLIYSRQADANR